MMYRKSDKDQLEFENFYLPFGGKLRGDNRWVRLAREIPWAELEDEYASLFSDHMGAPAKSFRMDLDALIIKERLSVTDEETVEQICETPYLQYFIGLEEFQTESPFDPSMMLHFRKRITPEILSRINETERRNIRLSGPRLGRPPKDTRKDIRQEREDSAMRNAIEGGFGTAKRRYGMNRIITRLQKTSETSISLVILVMNLEKLLRDIFVQILYWLVQPIKLNTGLKFQAA